MYTNENNTLSNREEYLQNGTILSAYKYRYPTLPDGYGREKMIMRRNFSSFLGGHKCFYCRQDFVPLNIARIAHFRSRVPMGEYEYSDTLTNKTELLKTELSLLFS